MNVINDCVILNRLFWTGEYKLIESSLRRATMPHLQSGMLNKIDLSVAEYLVNQAIAKHMHMSTIMPSPDDEFGNFFMLLSALRGSATLLHAFDLAGFDIKSNHGDLTEKGLHAIHYAAVGGQTDLVKKWIEGGVFPADMLTGTGGNLLEYAASGRNQELVTYLLSKGLDINNADIHTDGETVFMHVITGQLEDKLLPFDQVGEEKLSMVIYDSL